MAILVQDSFNRANSTTLGNADTGQAWQSLGTGVFGITSNQAYLSTLGADSLVYTDSLNTDVKVSVTIAVNQGQPGIYFRVVDATNWIRAIRVSGTLYLQKKVAGTQTTLSTKALAYVANEKLTIISKNDGTIEFYSNDVLQISLTDTAHSTSTKHGFGIGSANASTRWEDFIVESLGATGTDGSSAFDLRQSIYSDGAANGDTTQLLFADGAVYSDSKQVIYGDSATLFDTLQEFFSDGIVGSTPFDIRMVLYADTAVGFDSKQALYTDGALGADLSQQFYQASESTTDLKLVIYADGSPKFDASQTLYSDAFLKADTAQRYFTEGTLDFDTLQAILDDWAQYNEVIRIVLNISRSQSATLEVTQRTQSELKL